MPKKQAASGDRVRVKGQGSTIWTVRSGNTNSLLLETGSGDSYRTTYAPRDGVTAVKDD